MNKGEIDSISIPQKTGVVRKTIAEKQESPFLKRTKLIQKNPFSNLERPDQDLF